MFTIENKLAIPIPLPQHQHTFFVYKLAVIYSDNVFVMIQFLFLRHLILQKIALC